MAGVKRFREEFGFLVEPACGAGLALVYAEDVEMKEFFLESIGCNSSSSKKE